MTANPFDAKLLNVNADLNWHTAVMGSILRTLRKERGCSLSHLQMLSGVDMAEIHRIEKGEQECRIQSLLKLCAALGTTPGYILDRSISAIGCKRTEIQKRILADADFSALKSRLTFATPEQIGKLAHHLVEACQAVSILLRCSDPVAMVKNYLPACQELQKGLVDFANRIAAIAEGVERASMIYGLLANPVGELQSQGLLPDAILTPEGLTALPPGAPDGFDVTSIPLPGDSYAIIEKPDGDFDLKPVPPRSQS